MKFEVEQEERRRMEDIRLQELELKRRELNMQEERDRREAARKNTVASKIKLFGDAFRNAAYRMSNEPVDLIPFFDNVEEIVSRFRDTIGDTGTNSTAIFIR
jgi:hypothetical protein